MDGIAISILSRREAEAFTCSEPYAIVGATDPEMPDPSYRPSEVCRRIVRLKFHDIQHQCCSEHVLFDDAHAQQIVDFAHWFREAGIGRLVVHCEAGISRSSAIALAVARFHEMDIDAVLDPAARYHPNAFVYWRLTRLLMPGREGALLNELLGWLDHQRTGAAVD